jgi:hypothetical protein
VHKAHSCSNFIFPKKFQTIIQHYLKHDVIISLGSFNFDILEDNNNVKEKKLLNFAN